ncbi:MAG: hypothetical protein ACFCBW_11465 [Candidatus Competibacterales bacterium]
MNIANSTSFQSPTASASHQATMQEVYGKNQFEAALGTHTHIDATPTNSAIVTGGWQANTMDQLALISESQPDKIHGTVFHKELVAVHESLTRNEYGLADPHYINDLTRRIGKGEISFDQAREIMWADYQAAGITNPLPTPEELRELQQNGGGWLRLNLDRDDRYPDHGTIDLDEIRRDTENGLNQPWRALPSNSAAAPGVVTEELGTAVPPGPSAQSSVEQMTTRMLEEIVTTMVENLYSQYLGFEPDRNGMEFWVNVGLEHGIGALLEAFSETAAAQTSA